MRRGLSTGTSTGWVTVLLLLLAAPAAAQDEHIPAAAGNTACSICHTCDFPTSEDLCLNKHFCLRSHRKASQVGLPDHDLMVLDELEKVYDPVYFDHDAHAQMSEMSGGCENCHHFIPPSSNHPACKECHLPEGRRGKVQPDLKAAYHRQCLDCHTEWDTESHCEFCHRKKDGGISDAELAVLPHRVHRAPLEVMDLITFETDYDEGDRVPFHHLNHVEKYNRDCSVCHQDESCSSCHVHGTESHPLGLISDVDLHDTCYQCHDEENGCEQCHGRNPNDLFDHASTGWELQPYHKVLQCADCHHDPGKYHANDPRCVTCHFDGWDEAHFNHAVTGVVLDSVHGELDCADCHIGGIGSHSSCESCHDDGREWHRQASFGPDVE
jgi:hypothetical protein